jgi:hypothetical protein
MSNMIKSCLSLCVFCLLIGPVKAQSGLDFKQYDLGIGLDFNSAYTDAQTIVSTKSGRLSFNYNFTPFVNYVVELQTGDLKGGNALTTTTGREFTNSFNSVILRGQLQAGEVIDYSQGGLANAFKSLYISSGIGFVVNHIKEINRYSVKTPGFYTDGENNSNQLLIPARIGYELKFYNKYGEPGFKIDMGYQYNFILGDGLDGFTAGKQKDSYAQFGLGIKFAIGGTSTYRKQISY